MIETPEAGLTPEQIAERDTQRFETLVTVGVLQKVDAGNGSMYVLPLPEGDMPLAFLTGSKTLVRMGDEVEFNRDLPPGHNPGKSVERIVQMAFNPRNGEIEVNKSVLGRSSVFRIHDISKNMSIGLRALDQRISTTRSPTNKT